MLTRNSTRIFSLAFRAQALTCNANTEALLTFHLVKDHVADPSLPLHELDHVLAFLKHQRLGGPSTETEVSEGPKCEAALILPTLARAKEDS